MRCNSTRSETGCLSLDSNLCNVDGDCGVDDFFLSCDAVDI